MAEDDRMKSVLSERIAAGKADPISDEERALVAEMEADFQRRFGRPSRSVLRSSSKTA